MTIELHCHTLFSVDGQGTPEQLVDVAARRGIKAMAITEHNQLGSYYRARARAQQHGISYYAGIELDARWQDSSFHFLGLGFDPDNSTLRQLAERQYAVYSQSFERLLPHFERFGYRVCRDELVSNLAVRYPTHPAPVLNRWHARQLLVEQGVFPDAKTYTQVIIKIQDYLREQNQEPVNRFCNWEEARDAVHGAGGIILLAHVGKYFPPEAASAASQIRLINELIDVGMDGFELYHPANCSLPHFDQLRAEAARLGCPVSGGSDCHNASSDVGNQIGDCGINGGGCVPESILATIDAALEKRQARSH